MLLFTRGAWVRAHSPCYSRPPRSPVTITSFGLLNAVHAAAEVQSRMPLHDTPIPHTMARLFARAGDLTS